MFDTKIELNWSVSPNSTNLKKTVNKISLKDVPSSEGGEVVAELGTMSQVCAEQSHTRKRLLFTAIIIRVESRPTFCFFWFFLRGCSIEGILPIKDFCPPPKVCVNKGG